MSSDSDEQLLSYQNQMSYYKRFLESNPDYEFVGLYADEGISGGYLKKREGFLRMLSDAKEGKLDVIYTKSISRFGRNTVDCLESVRALKECNVNVVFEKEHIETMKAEGEVLMTVLMALAQNEVHNLSENIKWGMRRKYERGDIGSVPIGNFIAYEKDEEGNIVIKEEGAATVRRVFELYLTGYAVEEIANILTSEGRKPERRTSGWVPSLVKGILKNEKMVGDTLCQKRFSADYLTKKMRWNRGELPQYYVSNTHEAIISREIWNAAQEYQKRDAVFSEKYHMGNSHVRATYRGLPLVSKCVCKACSLPYVRRSIPESKKHERIFYWTCRALTSKPHLCQHERYRIPEERFTGVFVEAWNLLIGSSEQYLKEPVTALQKYKRKELDKLIIEKGVVASQEYELVISTLDHIGIGIDGYADVYFYAGAKITIKI